VFSEPFRLVPSCRDPEVARGLSPVRMRRRLLRSVSPRTLVRSKYYRAMFLAGPRLAATRTLRYPVTQRKHQTQPKVKFINNY